MESSHKSLNYTAPLWDQHNIGLNRNVLPADVRKQRLDKMPGFRLSWHYSGVEVEPWAKYDNEDTEAFVRNHSNIIIPP